MGSKLGWLVVIVGLLVAWGSVRGALWSALTTYASGGQVDVVHTHASLTSLTTATVPATTDPTVILAQRVGSTTPGATSGSSSPTTKGVAL